MKYIINPITLAINNTSENVETVIGYFLVEHFNPRSLFMKICFKVRDSIPFTMKKTRMDKINSIIQQIKNTSILVKYWNGNYSKGRTFNSILVQVGKSTLGAFDSKRQSCHEFVVACFILIQLFRELPKLSGSFNNLVILIFMLLIAGEGTFTYLFTIFWANARVCIYLNNKSIYKETPIQ